jgi:hypothetical protein
MSPGIVQYLEGAGLGWLATHLPNSTRAEAEQAIWGTTGAQTRRMAAGLSATMHRNFLLDNAIQG